MSTVQPGTFAPADFLNPERPFGLYDLVRLLRRRGRTVLKVAAGFVVLTIIALLIWPSHYTPTAVVMLDPRRNNVTDRSQVLTELPTDPSSVQDQIQILTSRDLAATVIDRLDLARDPEFNRALASFPLNLLPTTSDIAAQHSAIIDGFLRHLTVESEGLSTAISVTFSAEEPDKAAQITNAVVQAYIDSQVAQKSEAAQRTTQWLETRIGELSRQVQTGDTAVQAYKAANGLNDSGQGTQSLIDQQLAVINNQLVQARADLAEKQAAYNHVLGLLKSGRVAEVSQVVASPLIVQLRQQQADAIRNAADLDTRYGPKHPKRIAAESQLRDLDSKVEQEAERIAGSVGNDAAVAQAQVRSLENSLVAARAQSNMQNLARVKLRALEASAASTRSTYESFVTRLREAQDQAGVTVPDARVISHATVPAKPSSPPRLLIICASVPAGLLVGLLYALVMERFGAAWPERGTSRGARSVAIPVVAWIPDASDPTAPDRLLDAPGAPFSRALLGMGARLSSFPGGSHPRTILVSGFDPRYAVANVALGLARALALLGHNVVLFDADLARSAAARMAGCTYESGIADVLRGAVPLSRAIAKDRTSPVLILGNAPSAAHAKAEWESQATRAVLEHLSRTSDFVIIHAPAQLDMVPLVRLAEGVLFVGAAGEAQALQRTAKAFAPAAEHLGIVIAD
ncbi:MAG TPA: exopolysaccharide transport family protein [Rhizomicrobium sp.]|nr:exopolysaccharide transport family protein [Rhizomicrobium sp.]